MTDNTPTSKAPPAEPTKALANTFLGGKNATSTIAMIIEAVNVNDNGNAIAEEVDVDDDGNATMTTKGYNAYSFISTQVLTGCDCCSTFIDLPATDDDSSTSNDLSTSNDSTTSDDSIASNDSSTSEENVASDDSVPRQRCIDEVTELLSSWSVEKLDYLIKVIENIPEGATIFWCQGLCDFYDKSLALGESNLDTVERKKCPSANTYDHLYKPLAVLLNAILVFINIRNLCKRTADGKNCMPATPDEAETMAKVICSVAELVRSLNGKFILNICGGSGLETMLLGKIRKEKSLADTITFVIKGSYHLSYYSYFNQRNFFTKELQQFRIFCALQEMC